MLAALTRIAARSICKQSAWQSATFSAAKFSASFASSKSPDAQQPPLSTAAFHQLADEALEEAASIFENAFETSRETDIHLAVSSQHALNFVLRRPNFLNIKNYNFLFYALAQNM